MSLSSIAIRSECCQYLVYVRDGEVYIHDPRIPEPVRIYTREPIVKLIYNDRVVLALDIRSQLWLIMQSTHRRSSPDRYLVRSLLLSGTMQVIDALVIDARLTPQNLHDEVVAIIILTATQNIVNIIVEKTPRELSDRHESFFSVIKSSESSLHHQLNPLINYTKLLMFEHRLFVIDQDGIAYCLNDDYPDVESSVLKKLSYKLSDEDDIIVSYDENTLVLRMTYKIFAEEGVETRHEILENIVKYVMSERFKIFSLTSFGEVYRSKRSGEYDIVHSAIVPLPKRIIDISCHDNPQDITTVVLYLDEEGQVYIGNTKSKLDAVPNIIIDIPQQSSVKNARSC